MPTKNAKVVAASPIVGPYIASSDSLALAKISTKDTYIITPAENPRAAERNFLFVCLV